jgi:hypothetical protein
MRKPAEYRFISCLCDDGQEHLLAYSNDRGFFEPITNVTAQSLGIKIISWEYEETNNGI